MAPLQNAGVNMDWKMFSSHLFHSHYLTYGVFYLIKVIKQS